MRICRFMSLKHSLVLCAFLPFVSAAQTQVHYYPGFYHAKPVVRHDTTFSFETYNQDHKLVSPFYLKEGEQIDEFVLVRTCRKPTEPGKPVMDIITSLESWHRMDQKIWSHEILATRKIEDVVVDTSRIVATDTIKMPATKLGPAATHVFRYGKVTRLSTDTPVKHHH